MHDFIALEDKGQLLTDPPFSYEDLKRMKMLANGLDGHTREPFSLFWEELHPTDENVEKAIEKNFQTYMNRFWNGDRNDEYVTIVTDFFKRMLSYRYSPMRLMAALNKMQRFWMQAVLKQRFFILRKQIDVLDTLQRAANVDKQILLKAVLEYIAERTAKESQKRSQQIESHVGSNEKKLAVSHVTLHDHEKLQKRIQWQRERMQQVTQAGEQLTASIHQVARQAATVAERSSETVRMAEGGKHVITTALEEILHSGGTFESIVHRFAELQRYLSNIEKMVDLIHQISDQTHLLALNAAIEAARSGDKGRGFSVVAQEIRKLAQSTKEAVQDIERNVEQVHSLTGEVAASIQTSSQVIQNGMQEADEAFHFVTNLILRVVEINEIIGQIAKLMTQQTFAAEKFFAQINEITADFFESSLVHLQMS